MELLQGFGEQGNWTSFQGTVFVTNQLHIFPFLESLGPDCLSLGHVPTGGEGRGSPVLEIPSETAHNGEDTPKRY